MTYQAPDLVTRDGKRWLWLNPPDLPHAIKRRLPRKRGYATDLYRGWICEWTLDRGGRLFLDVINDRTWPKKPPYNPILRPMPLETVFVAPQPDESQRAIKPTG